MLVKSSVILKSYTWFWQQSRHCLHFLSSSIYIGTTFETEIGNASQVHRLLMRHWWRCYVCDVGTVHHVNKITHIFSHNRSKTN
jgi:hypothetical protein